MTEDNRPSKVVILIQQKKYAQAESLLNGLLSEDADNVDYLSLLAEVYLQLDRIDAAKTLVNRAIGLSPDSPDLFYIRSRIAIQQDEYAEAEMSIKQAIEIDPYEADYFALWANIKLVRKQYGEALELADKALEIDAENLLGLNTRSTALLKLNRKEESFETIEGALREDPNNAFTHANLGWGLLEKGDHKRALHHFKESLNKDPNFDYAQAGLLEALKATNPVYRLYLNYSFWMSNLTAKYQWGVIIGFYVVFRALKSLSKNNEALQPYLTPILITLGLLAFSTWVLNPIGNLFLRFNPYGQLLLDKNEKTSSNFVAASVGILVIGVLLYFLLGDEKFLSVVVFGFAMMLPFSVMYSPSKYKHALLIYAVAMSLIGICAIGLTFTTDILFNFLSIVFIVGFVAFQWVANFLLIQQDNK